MNVKERLLDAFPHLAEHEPRLAAELAPLLTHRLLADWERREKVSLGRNRVVILDFS